MTLERPANASVLIRCRTPRSTLSGAAICAHRHTPATAAKPTIHLRMLRTVSLCAGGLQSVGHRVDDVVDAHANRLVGELLRISQVVRPLPRIADIGVVRNR